MPIADGGFTPPLPTPSGGNLVACILVLVVVVLAVVPYVEGGSGHRFVARKGVIEELPAFADEHDWFTHIAAALHVPLTSTDSLAAQHVPVDAIWMHRILSQRSLDDPWKQAIAVNPRAFTLVQVSARSIFVIGSNGRLFERYFNGDTWEYVRHVAAPPRHERLFHRLHHGQYAPHCNMDAAVALTRVVHGSYEGLIVADVAGRLVQRVADAASAAVRWVDVSIPGGLHVYSRGFASQDGTFYVVSHEGALHARRMWPMAASSWRILGGQNASMARLALVVHVASQDNSGHDVVYVLTHDGTLVQVDTSSGKWTDCGPPSGIRLALQPMAAVTSTLSSLLSSLFMASSKGLVEFTLDSKRWHVHGHPPDQLLHGGALASVDQDARILAISDERSLWQWTRDDMEWEEVTPPLPAHVTIARVPPTVVSHRHANDRRSDGQQQHHELIVLLEDGRLASKRMDASGTAPWTIHCVPEGGPMTSSTTCGYDDDESIATVGDIDDEAIVMGFEEGTREDEDDQDRANLYQ
ncbi:Aste57867_16261 [Aphanomyces stellatus]|uniref:Aste57867_16261 protein n=1 Tax=Aphanomyces stellatus TaxID=120398 RepID=A0A485L610_9STRA|nr:hypothetical protein As57867_016204 [Aphanomyces stellatus]VFT93038.1 Aste57867_16261 [Aphanomyces stellatus]